MADKKNIVIKVKYPVPGNKAVKDDASPTTVTEWNIQRIALALTGIVIILASLVYFLNRDNPVAEPEKPVAVSQETNLDLPAKPEIKTDNHVVRSILSYQVIDNEPVNEISLPIKLGKKGSTWLYYFVELNNMKGKSVYHEWLLDGELISRKKVNISDNQWRTASRQSFKYSSQNRWTVRLVDDSGAILDEKNFNVIYQ